MARAPEFRTALTARGLMWGVGVDATQRVYPADVELIAPAKPPLGRPQTDPIPTAPTVEAKALIEALITRRGRRAFRELSWRRGTKGLLLAEFAAVRVRVADGPRIAGGKHLPGEAAWLVSERRANGERKYYLTNHPPRTSVVTLARTIKARWVCEQVHQQLEEELGLDHFEGRSWLGLHHHALLTMIAFAYLQHRRLRAVARRRRRRGGKTWPPNPRPTSLTNASCPPPTDRRPSLASFDAMSALSRAAPVAA